MPSSERTKLLVTVLTYPHPSVKYQETVCTAGITEGGQWIRLYPLPLRTLPADKRIRKWMWIEVDLFPHSGDKRPESRRPDVDSIQILERPIEGKFAWDEKRRWIEKLAVHSLEEWRHLEREGVASLGVVRPKRVLDVTAQRLSSSEWTTEQKQALQQTNLFSEQVLKLDKIPYSFYVRFQDQSEKEENLLIPDWEIGENFRKSVEKYSESEAARLVCDHYLNDVFSVNREPYLFVGTHHRFRFFMAIGVFWPPKREQGLLNIE